MFFGQRRAVKLSLVFGLWYNAINFVPTSRWFHNVLDDPDKVLAQRVKMDSDQYSWCAFEVSQRQKMIPILPDYDNSDTGSEQYDPDWWWRMYTLNDLDRLLGFTYPSTGGNFEDGWGNSPFNLYSLQPYSTPLMYEDGLQIIPADPVTRRPSA